MTFVQAPENTSSAVEPGKVSIGNCFKMGKTIQRPQPFKTSCYTIGIFLVVSICPYLGNFHIITVRECSYQNFSENFICCLQKTTQFVNSLFCSLIFAFVRCEQEHKVVYHLFQSVSVFLFISRFMLMKIRRFLSSSFT